MACGLGVRIEKKQKGEVVPSAKRRSGSYLVRVYLEFGDWYYIGPEFANRDLAHQWRTRILDKHGLSPSRVQVLVQFPPLP